jgi:hypothetical protein
VGVERLLLLEELEVSGAPLLTDLTSLPGHLPSLRSLKFETCGGITSLALLARRSELEALSVANCGPIETLTPLREMQNLRRLYLYESTRVADGDLTPLLALNGLEDLRMMNRKHYVPTVGEVKSALGIGK